MGFWKKIVHDRLHEVGRSMDLVTKAKVPTALELDLATLIQEKGWNAGS
jgi:hypothetical protein